MASGDKAKCRWMPPEHPRPPPKELREINKLAPTVHKNSNRQFISVLTSEQSRNTEPLGKATPDYYRRSV